MNAETVFLIVYLASIPSCLASALFYQKMEKTSAYNNGTLTNGFVILTLLSTLIPFWNSAFTLFSLIYALVCSIENISDTNRNKPDSEKFWLFRKNKKLNKVKNGNWTFTFNKGWEYQESTIKGIEPFYYKSNHESPKPTPPPAKTDQYEMFRGLKPLFWAAGKPIFTTYERDQYLNCKDKLLSPDKKYIEYHKSLYNKPKANVTHWAKGKEYTVIRK